MPILLLLIIGVLCFLIGISLIAEQKLTGWILVSLFLCLLGWFVVASNQERNLVKEVICDVQTIKVPEGTRQIIIVEGNVVNVNSALGKIVPENKKIKVSFFSAWKLGILYMDEYKTFEVQE